MSAFKFDLTECRPRAPDDALITKLAAILWNQCQCCATSPADGSLTPLTRGAERLMLSMFNALPHATQLHWRTTALASCAVILNAWGATATPIEPPKE